VDELTFANAPGLALTVLGGGFLVANLQLVGEFVRFFRYRSRALVTWPGRKPAHYGLLLGLGAVFAVLVFVKVVIQQRPPIDVFGEGMMLLYYGYLWPMSFRIGRGLYEHGIWAEAGFMPYRSVGAFSWRETPALTLVINSKARRLARPLSVPREHYGEVRRLLRDKIANRDIDLTGKSFDLGSDDRETV
jgi:hypothetical protein